MRLNVVLLLMIAVFLISVGCTESKGRIIKPEEEIEKRMPDTVRSIEDMPCCNELSYKEDRRHSQDDLEIL